MLELTREENTLQLNVEKGCTNGQCNCARGKFEVTVEKKVHYDDFFSYTHERKDQESFLLKPFIGGKNWLPEHITKATKVTIYYWSKSENNPLFLEVSVQGGEEPQYYYNYLEYTNERNNWKNVQDKHDLKQRLEDRNCGVNGAVVLKINEGQSKDAETYASSTCLKEKKDVVTYQKSTFVISDYTIDSYKFTGSGEKTKLSKLEFGDDKNKISIVPPEKPITCVRIFSWTRRSAIPLLVEFIPQDGGHSTWSENTGGATTKWATVDSTNDFYKGGGKTELSEQFFRKIKEVNCNVNHVVDIDVAQTDKKNDGKYCHNGHNGKKRISVNEASATYAPGNSLFSYKVFSHTPNEEAYLEDAERYDPEECELPTFTISGFTNNGKPITLKGLEKDLPILDATKVIVYACNNDPLLIYIPQAGKNKWYKHSSGNDWQTVTELSKQEPNQHAKILKELDQIKSPCQVPSVTVDINQRPKNGNDSTYKYPPSGKTSIKLTKKEGGPSAEVPSGYIEYIHELQEKNPRDYFTLVGAQYDKVPIEGIGRTPKVSSVSVYYWSKLENGKSDDQSKGRPLLIKVTQNEGKRTRWYENNETPTNPNTRWVLSSEDFSSNGKLKTRLDEANCQLNGVVVIDVLRNGDYCHTAPDHKRRIKVQDADPTNKLINYKAYSHTPSFDRIFAVSDFTTGGTSIKFDNQEPSLPIFGIKKVTVYLCIKDDNKTPLLLYYEQYSTVGNAEKWFKESSGTWKEVTYPKIPSYETNYEAILGLLDGMQSGCMPPSVVIDISQKTGQQVSCTYDDPRDTSQSLKRRQIKVTKMTSGTADPPQYYDRYDHTVEGRDKSYFTVTGVWYGHCRIRLDTGIFPPTENVTSVSVYCWSKLDDGRPLLLKVESRQQKSDPIPTTIHWYENVCGGYNTNWKVATGDTSNNLQKKLNLLNCKLNYAVIVNASIKPNEREVDCYDSCNDGSDTGTLDPWHGKRLKVEEVTPSDTPPPDKPTPDGKGPLATYKVYSHTRNCCPGRLFHIVGFRNGSEGGTAGASITLQGSTGSGTESSPIMNVRKVLVYFCSSEKSPLLIYYQTYTQPGHNWFKKPDGAGSWTTVGDLHDVDPTSTDHHAKILEQLDSIKSPCQVPSVTINIGYWPANKEQGDKTTYQTTDTSCANRQTMQVTSTPIGSSSYLFFTHTVDGNTRSHFIVGKVTYGQNDVTFVDNPTTPIDKVTSFSAYYWKHHPGKTNPLLIKIERLDSTYPEWYEDIDETGKSLKWQKMSDEKAKELSGATLENELNSRNRTSNRVTDIKFSMKPKDSSTGSTGSTTSVGTSVESHDVVENKDITNDQYNGKLGRFAVCSYELTEKAKKRSQDKETFHVTSFFNEAGDGIKLPGLPEPTLDVSKLMLFKCNTGETGKTLLLYIEHGDESTPTRLTRGESPSRHSGQPTCMWFKKPYGKGGIEWTRLTDGEVPKDENHTAKILSILETYITPCKNDILIYIAMGVATCFAIYGCFLCAGFGSFGFRRQCGRL